MATLSLFMTCPRGVEPLLARELAALGTPDCLEAKGGVAVQADLEGIYRACLWSRLASRALLPLERLEAGDADALYAAARRVDWPAVFDLRHSFAIEVAGRTPGIANTHHAALRLKDAVADTFRERFGARPDVDTEHPDLRLHLYLDRRTIVLSLDLAGHSLHRRGYRRQGAEAPLKENLASAILTRCGWPTESGAYATLFDPMCGSGTLLIEGAMMATDIAPGLRRRHWGFEAWNGHRPALWSRVHAEAENRRDTGLAALQARFHGSDIDPRAIAAARANVERAGLTRQIDLSIGDALEATPPADAGLLVCNLPYGERLADETELIRLTSLLGDALKSRFGGWRCGLFTARADLAPRLGLRAKEMHSLYNGALPCKLLQFDIPAGITDAADGEAADFDNRLRKNLRHLRRWAAREDVACYRVYDADLPEYALAVDLYRTESGETHAHVQEYAAPAGVDPVRAEKRLRAALAAILHTVDIPPRNLHYKLRRAQRGASQYQRRENASLRQIVDEHGARIEVDFEAYLDTGLFLDHRPLRRRIRGEARGKRFLNLFCYTGSASVHAAIGGAATTVSVDLSNTYLLRAQRNLELNGLRAESFERPPSTATGLSQHCLIRTDVRTWLQSHGGRPASFDLILLDPPTFSNSKKMEGSFDIRRDHASLLDDAMRLLAPGGTLYFSNNRRGFKLDPELHERYDIRDITAQTLAEDFRRPPPAHRCWTVRWR